MHSNEERLCKYCGTVNYGVIHHCLKCGADLPAFSSREETLVDFNEQITPAPKFEPRPPTPPDYLEVISVLDRGYTYNLTDGISFGRSGSCDIVIESPKVSRHHARISRSRDQRWVLSDLGSTNGTMLNNLKIAQPTELADNDEIQVGDFCFKVVINQPIPTRKPRIIDPEPELISEDQTLPLPEKNNASFSSKKIILTAGILIMLCVCSTLYFSWDILSKIVIK